MGHVKVGFQHCSRTVLRVGHFIGLRDMVQKFEVLANVNLHMVFRVIAWAGDTASLRNVCRTMGTLLCPRCAAFRVGKKAVPTLLFTNPTR